MVESPFSIQLNTLYKSFFPLSLPFTKALEIQFAMESKLT